MFYFETCCGEKGRGKASLKPRPHPTPTSCHAPSIFAAWAWPQAELVLSFPWILLICSQQLRVQVPTGWLPGGSCAHKAQEGRRQSRLCLWLLG